VQSTCLVFRSTPLGAVACDVSNPQGREICEIESASVRLTLSQPSLGLQTLRVCRKATLTPEQLPCMHFKSNFCP
jgi:hypothetical protein